MCSVEHQEANINTCTIKAYFYMLLMFIEICDMIKGNESLVEQFQILVSYVIFSNLKMLDFDANPIKVGYLVTEL